MTDQQFLWWIHERLVKAHGEREMVDYMHHLRAIIVDTPPKNETPRVARMDSDADVLRKRFGSTPNVKVTCPPRAGHRNSDEHDER